MSHKYSDYVKASWVADCDLLAFVKLSQDEIDLAMIIYNDMDRKFCKSKLDDYGKKDFFLMSDKLDRRS